MLKLWVWLQLLLFCVSLSAQTIQLQNLEPARAESGKWGYRRGNHWVIKPQYDRAFAFSEELAVVRLHGKFGFIDLYDKQVVAFRFDEAIQFSEGLAAVKMNNKWGFIDRTGKVVLPYKYDNALGFCEGMAAVKLNGKWGFIDRSGGIVIPFQFDHVSSFQGGLAMIRLGDFYGYVDRENKQYKQKSEYEPRFSDYAKRYVEQRVNEWQQKGKYEKTVDWQHRVTDANTKAKIVSLTKEAEHLYLTEMMPKVQLEQYIRMYDADNETFLVEDERFGDLLVPVSINDAPDFEESFYSMKCQPRYFIANDRLALAELTFTSPKGKSFQYSNASSLSYQIDAGYQYNPIDLDSTFVINPIQPGRQQILHSQRTGVRPDVDVNIPHSRNENKNTIAVIIANEHYKYEDPVPFAVADGDIFRKYCVHTLGIPEKQILYCEDATLGDLRRAVGWLQDVSEVFDVKHKVIFYYSGHGVPNERTQSTYLLPIDGSARDVEVGYELSRLYQELGELSAESVTVFLDACFSGNKREGGLMLATRGVNIKPQSAAVPVNGKVTVFSASQGDETALPYNKMGHGLFTYFLLKKLQETKGDASLGELVEYVTAQVAKESVLSNNKRQTPTIIFSPVMINEWQLIKWR